MDHGGKTKPLPWKALWAGYNLILLVEALVLFRGHVAALLMGYLPLIVMFAAGANACFWLGPMHEFIVKSILARRAGRPCSPSFLSGLRYFVFALGLLVAMGMVLAWSFRGVPKLEDAKRRAVKTQMRH
jgi:hypothetical protein